MSIQTKIKQLSPWFHNIHLPTGEQTAPHHFLGDFPGFKWHKIKTVLPQNLTGFRVLDIGCNAGFYSLELAKMGADIVAIDMDEHYLKQARWVAKEFELDSKIEFRQLQVYDLAKSEERFDIVWFMGVFYHLRYPLLALDILSRLTKRYLLFQTLSIPGEKEMEVPDNIEFHKRSILNDSVWPKLAFIEYKFAGDPTNWWIANHQGVLSLLRNCGFKISAIPDDETYLAVKDPTDKIEDTWNATEYLAAIGENWKSTINRKTGKKN